MLHEDLFLYNSTTLLFQIYGIYYQDVFIKTSTALTTVIAFSRYLGICHPLQFRHCARLLVTKATIFCSFLFWILMNLPLLWKFEVHMFPGYNSTIYLIDAGSFVKNHSLHMTFTYVWAIIGYFIPLAIITFCNIKLVQALRRSQKLRQANARYCSTGQNRSRITITLIALTTMYLLLMSPSEILHFYIDTAQPKNDFTLERAIICTNLLQAVNFSCHFILYCIVNSTFRNIMIAAFRRPCLESNHASYHSTISNATCSSKLQHNVDNHISVRWSSSMDGHSIKLPEVTNCLTTNDCKNEEDTGL